MRMLLQLVQPLLPLESQSLKSVLKLTLPEISNAISLGKMMWVPSFSRCVVLSLIHSLSACPSAAIWRKSPCCSSGQDQGMNCSYHFRISKYINWYRMQNLQNQQLNRKPRLSLSQSPAGIAEMALKIFSRILVGRSISFRRFSMLCTSRESRFWIGHQILQSSLFPHRRPLTSPSPTWTMLCPQRIQSSRQYVKLF